MKIHVLAFGKIKVPGLRECAQHYLKLLRPWIPILEKELKPVPVPDKSPATRSAIQQKEAILLEQELRRQEKSHSLLVLLDEGGENLSTQQWANLLQEWKNSGLKEIHFCLGSSLGFSPEIRKKSDRILALGSHTMAHPLARVVFYEQIYRAQSVLENHPYHNAGS